MTRRLFLAQTAATALLRGKDEDALRLLEEQTSSGHLAAAVLLVRRGSKISQYPFGKARTPDAVFLLASITKPMTATCVMALVDRKKLSLADPVQRFIPEFRGDGREAVLIQHLLTHTSGLPDMLPEDQELRKQHAPLSAFLAGACRTPLLFRPGSQLRYQSMGILLAGEIVSRVSGQPLPVFMKENVFQPLGMTRTSLGLGGRSISDTMLSQLPEATDWDWNSSYWRNLGSPWGGGHASAGDVARFLQYFVQPDKPVLKKETAAVMITNQVGSIHKRWGLGWMLQDGQFAKGCSPETFGHSGSTGTLCWLDPKSDTTFVLLTTLPAKESNKTILSPVSEKIASAAGV